MPEGNGRDRHDAEGEAARDLVVSDDRLERYRADRQLSGFEDDRWDLPLGPLLVAGVSSVSRGDLGPELGPLLLGGGTGDHGTSSA